MKVFRKLKWALPLTMVFILSLFAQAQANPSAILFDHYETTYTLTQSGVGVNSASFTGPTILGGEVDVIADVQAGLGSLLVDSNTSFLHRLSTSAGAGVYGITTIIYDGIDNSPNVNPIGLGGIDLTDGGVNRALVAAITSDDNPATVTITVHSSTNECSNSTKILPGGVFSTSQPFALVFSFNTDFNTDASCSSPAVFSRVGAVSIKIDSSVYESTDVTMELLSATFVDFGDAPFDGAGSAYYTSIIETGPLHAAVNGLMLGASVDGEDDAIAGTFTADGDDITDVDDENGVIPLGHWLPDTTTSAQVQVTVNGGDGCLNAWIDWNQDTTFNNSVLPGNRERVIVNQEVTTGVYYIDISVPTGFDPANSPYYARFRLYERDPNGSCTLLKYPNRDGSERKEAFVIGGEVEDYEWNFRVPTAVTLSNIEARNNTPTMIAAAVTLLVILSGGAVLAYKRSRA